MQLNFAVFWQHFIYMSSSSAYDFLRFAAIGYFIHSFIFQMRLVQEAFRQQNVGVSRNSLRRRLLAFYLLLYLGLIVFFVWQEYALYHSIFILLVHGSVWLPQIHLTYVMNRRNSQPPISFYLGNTLA